MSRWIRWFCIVTLCLMFLWHPPVTQAGTPCSDFSAERIEYTTQLSPEIPRQRSQDANQVFYEQRMLVRFKPGWAVLLAGSADGQADIVIDDILEIKVQDTSRSWSHDFRTPDHQAIMPLPPQDITHLFAEAPGVSLTSVQVQAKDVLAPEYRASELWLIVWRACVPTPTPAPPTKTPAPTLTGTPTATDTVPAMPTDTTLPPTPIPTWTWTPEPTITLEPTATPTMTASIAVPDPPAAHAASTQPELLVPWRMMLGMSLLLLSGLGLIVWQMTARARRPRGLVEIYLAESGEFVANYVLQQLRKVVLTVGAKGDIWLPDLANSGPVARIYTRRDGGERVTLLDLLAETDANTVLQTIEVYDGLRLTFPPYVLTYQQQVEEIPRTVTQQEQNYV